MTVYSFPKTAETPEYSDIQKDLSHAFQIFAHLELDDLTYTHLSARHPEINDRFYLNPLGPMFFEITPEMLLEVDFEGKIHNDVVSSDDLKFAIYNNTGSEIHSAVYKARPDVNCVMHLHTPHAVAVSSMKEGLLPLSQFAFHFYDNIALHDYNGLVLEGGEVLGEDLGDKSSILLRNHGYITVGKTVQEAFFYAYYLNRACEVQCMAMAATNDVVIPSDAICRKARTQMRNFEHDLGQRDFAALKRKYGLT